MTKTVGYMLAESLAAHDIDIIYCVPGESYLGLTDALSEFPGIKLVVCRHEGGAGFMAAADGRMRNGRVRAPCWLCCAPIPANTPMRLPARQDRSMC